MRATEDHRSANTLSATNAFFDFVLALFPISFVKDLNIKSRQKIVLGGLMSCGIVYVDLL